MGTDFSRVAFKLLDANGNITNEFKFFINPQNIQDSYTSRNVFQQSYTTQLMQGYGAGPHTIVISGTTGVNQRLSAVGGSVGQDDNTGFAKLTAMKNIILAQLNNAHDASTDGSLGTTLIFNNYTSNESWVVELDSNAFQITQSSDDPNSYYYNISMVVMAPYSDPQPAEISTIELGNAIPSIASRTLNQTQLNTNLNNLNRLYSVELFKEPALITDEGTSGLIENTSFQGINSIENKYSLNTSGVFDLHPALNYGTLYAYYSSMYTGQDRTVYLLNNNNAIIELKISPLSKYWKSYWELFLRQSSNNSGTSNIGFTPSGANAPLEVMLNGSATDGKNYLNINSINNKNDKDFATLVGTQDWGSAIAKYGSVDRTEALATASQNTLQIGYQTFFSNDSNDDDTMTKFNRCQCMYDLTQQFSSYGMHPGHNLTDKVPSNKMALLFNLFYGTAMNDTEYTHYLSDTGTISGSTNVYNGTDNVTDYADFNTVNDNVDNLVIDNSIYSEVYKANVGIQNKRTNGYLNPLVSISAPKYAYSEISNILQV